MELLGYIGPGAGLSLIGALIGLLGSIAFSLAMIVIYPLRKMLKARAATAAPAKAQQDPK
ncbi:MAG: hypothetical protein KDA58_11425 [Planctomycetaceae bacterium]|nr:hypothetical protein [Planctomycetaceae bacterium]